MHLCALAEAEDRKSRREEGISPLLPPSLSSTFAAPPRRFHALASNPVFARLSSLSLSLCLAARPFAPLSASTLRSHLFLVFLPLLGSSWIPGLRDSSLERAAAYIGGTDGIIVRRGPRFGFCGALTRRACGPAAVSYGPARARHTSVRLVCVHVRPRDRTRPCARARCERTSRNIAPRLVGIGYRGHSVAVASFLAHYWPPAPISLRPRSPFLSLSLALFLYTRFSSRCFPSRGTVSRLEQEPCSYWTAFRICMLMSVDAGPWPSEYVTAEFLVGLIDRRY